MIVTEPAGFASVVLMKLVVMVSMEVAASGSREAWQSLYLRCWWVGTLRELVVLASMEVAASMSIVLTSLLSL